MDAAHGHGHDKESGHGQRHTPQHGHGHSRAPGQAPEPGPHTEGRLIRQARFYDLRVWLMFLGRVGTLRRASLNLAALRPGERVLDVGCGSGDLALAAARQVGKSGEVWGIDAAPEMVEVARGKAKRRGLNARFQVEAVEALPFADASFDVVLSSLMMHHLPDDLRRRALAEIRRVLQLGGRIVIVDLDATGRMPRPWEPGWLVTRRHKLHKVHAHPTSEVRARGAALGDLLRDAGFESVESGATRYSWIGYTRGHVPA
jgi:ubiquinone/menaquinone biosynthesis C-methylase UbiE